MLAAFSTLYVYYLTKFTLSVLN